MCQSRGHAKNKQPLRSAAPKPKSHHWMLVCVWKAVPHRVYGTQFFDMLEPTLHPELMRHKNKNSISNERKLIGALKTATMPLLTHTIPAGELFVFKNPNEAMIKMSMKGMSPNMRHVSKTHRVDHDWFFLIKSIFIKPSTSNMSTPTKESMVCWWIQSTQLFGLTSHKTQFSSSFYGTFRLSAHSMSERPRSAAKVRSQEGHSHRGLCLLKRKDGSETNVVARTEESPVTHFGRSGATTFFAKHKDKGRLRQKSHK